MKPNKNLETFLKRGRKIVHDDRCRRAMIAWNNREHPTLNPPKIREKMKVKAVDKMLSTAKVVMTKTISSRPSLSLDDL